VSGQTCAALAEGVQTHVIWTVGGITFGLTVVAAIAAWSARETYRIHLNDGGEALGGAGLRRGLRAGTWGGRPRLILPR
jgi:hypothetical protein